MVGGIVFSTLLHGIGLGVLIFGVPSLAEKPPVLPWTPVPVDIVDIGEITNTRRLSDTKPTKRTSPEKKPIAQPQKKSEPPPPPEKKPKPIEKVEEKSSKDDVLLPTKDKKKEEKKSPPKQEPKKEEIEPDPLTSVLKNLADVETTNKRTIDDAALDEVLNMGESIQGESQGFGTALSDRLTISQEDALRRQIGSCWNMPVGARYAEDLIVEVLIEMNEDRTVRSAQVVDQRRYSSDSHFRAAAEAALRALRHPRCTPLALPEGQYEQWKTIRFNFDPRDML